MTTVSISRCSTYDPTEVAAALTAALSPLGGMAAFVSPGCQELCPPQVIGLKVPPIARFATRGRGK